MEKARTSLVAVGRLDVREQRGRASPSVADEARGPLDQVEQLLALLAHERPPEQRAQLADVAAQSGVALSRGRR